MQFSGVNVFDMGYEEFSKEPVLGKSLASLIVKGLSLNADKNILCDYTWGDKDYCGRQLLQLALALSVKIKTLSEKKRIGLVLMPSMYAVVANCACILAGKVPVNINFTMGVDALNDCVKLAGIDTMISAKMLREKLQISTPAFPWSENYREISEMIDSLDASLLAEIDTHAKDAEYLLKKFGIDENSDNKKEATLIFTSGSESKPKAAILSEKNIIANSLQVKKSVVFEEEDTLLANLPVFHSFGLLFEVWYIALFGQKTLTLYSPIDIKGNIKAVREKRPTVMLGTPTFFRAYFKRATKEDFSCIRKAISGAEKTPEGFEDFWNETFGKSYSEGYGLTETSPVVSVNLPERNLGYFTTGRRKGSVGKLFPGMRACVINPETMQTLPFGEQGVLCMQGPNVFLGYYKDETSTKKVLDNDWLITGDLARIDSDGFLFIDGRIKRFSKIAGEMVSHLAVESALAKGFNVADSEVPLIAVSSRLDSEKGEAIVLLSTFDIAIPKLKEVCRNAKISNLAIPRHIIRVDKIPVLSTGKLDLKRVAELAKG